MPTCVRAQRRDDALRHGLPHGERIADSEHEIAHLQLIGIAEFQRRYVLRALHAQNSKIGARIAQDDLRLDLAPVTERHLHLRHALDNMIIGDDEAGVVDDHARSQRLRLPLLAEKLAEERIVHQRIARLALLDALPHRR